MKICKTARVTKAVRKNPQCSINVSKPFPRFRCSIDSRGLTTELCRAVKLKNNMSKTNDQARLFEAGWVQGMLDAAEIADSAKVREDSHNTKAGVQVCIKLAIEKAVDEGERKAGGQKPAMSETVGVKALASATCSPAAPKIQDAITAWLVPHLEGFFGPRKEWGAPQTDKYHELLGLLYCYESEKQENRYSAKPRFGLIREPQLAGFGSCGCRRPRCEKSTFHRFGLIRGCGFGTWPGALLKAPHLERWGLLRLN